MSARSSATRESSSSCDRGVVGVGSGLPIKRSRSGRGNVCGVTAEGLGWGGLTVQQQPSRGQRWIWDCSTMLVDRMLGRWWRASRSSIVSRIALHSPLRSRAAAAVHRPYAARSLRSEQRVGLSVAGREAFRRPPPPANRGPGWRAPMMRTRMTPATSPWHCFGRCYSLGKTARHFPFATLLAHIDAKAATG